MHRFVNTALASAEAAAAVHRTHAGRVRTEDARDKSQSDFVSRVDMEAQAACLDRIRMDFPDHRILAEEDDGEGRSAEGWDPRIPVWVVDPLDGTTNFLHGHPAYASSVGVILGGEVVAGAVVSAASGERWWAGRGEGAFRNGEAIRVSQTRRLDTALVGTGFPFKRHDLLPEYLEQFRRVLPATTGVRRCGAAALDLCFLAQGSLDAFWELWLAPWDVAGGLCVLAEAGGTARRIGGDPLDPLKAGTVLAANSSGLLEALERTLVRS
jgi:myo-inositol-1(or 4)-monophosphatase